MTTITPENNPARSVLASIVEAMQAYRKLEQGETDSVEYNGDTYTDADDLRESLEGEALSVEVRYDWHAPGTDAEKTEYRLLMSWGGPAVQITGTLGRFSTPDTVKIQGQEWFQPWTDLPLETEEEDALLEYASLFYYGE